ncbi:MAG: glycosyltransferase family 2 protein [Methanoregula sp.]
MTTAASSTALKDESFTLPRTFPTYTMHLIQVKDVEPPQRGIYAVLPAYNEELVIGTVVLRTRQHADRVIVVDNGSADRTAEVAKLAGAEVVRIDHTLGKGHALLLGLRHARKTGCTVAVTLDADGQHDPGDIQRVAGMVSIGKADIVIGSRFLNNTRKSPHRGFGQKTLGLFTTIGSKTRVTDSHSGFRAFSCQALDNLDFSSEGYDVESDMMAHFTRMGLPVTEVPLSVNTDMPDKYQKHLFSHGHGFFSGLINRVFYRRPLLMFGVPGAFLVFAGLFAGSYAFSEYYTTSKFSFSLSMGSMLGLIMGMLLIIAGLMLNSLVMMMKEYRH